MAMRYNSMEYTDGQKHDEAYAEVEVYLLNKIKETGSASVARDWAEAYALVQGSLTSTTARSKA